jgi:hypothetical protein
MKRITNQEEQTKRALKDITRRHFLYNLATGIGGIALGSLTGCYSGGNKSPLVSSSDNPLALKSPHFLPKAKNVIYLHMAGAPSQLELFDYKPLLHKLNGQDCPKSFLEGKKFAFIKGVPKLLGPVVSEFKQHGNSGAYISNYLPYLQTVADEISFIKTMYTDQFNHAPAQLFMHTGSPRLGRPSIGAWVTYGLGSGNENLPGFIVLASGGKTPDAGKSVWGSGFLPSVYQGVQCRSEGDPVLYVSDPAGMDRNIKGELINTINGLNKDHYEEVLDPEIQTRISQYEMAYKMQISVPEVMSINHEPQYIHEMYGTEPGKSTFANNCLLARRLVEKGVRYVQLFHWGWDSHGTDPSTSLNGGFIDRCREVDQPMTALIRDLKQRGLLDETLIVWGGEFGRTPMRELREGGSGESLGRDHHADAFTIWMAGGGIKPGISYGETDEIGYYGISNRVHVHDLQATILNQLGFDHEKLTYNFQGRNFRLTDVHGKVVKDLIM